MRFALINENEAVESNIALEYYVEVHQNVFEKSIVNTIEHGNLVNEDAMHKSSFTFDDMELTVTITDGLTTIKVFKNIYVSEVSDDILMTVYIGLWEVIK